MIKSGIVRELIVDNPGEFITPEWCYEEVTEHESVWNRNSLSTTEVNSILNEFKRYFVISIEKRYYSEKMTEAYGLISDPDDVPIVAMALSIENKGVWTFDMKHFDKKKIKEKMSILNTRDVKRILEK